MLLAALRVHVATLRFYLAGSSDADPLSELKTIYIIINIIMVEFDFP